MKPRIIALAAAGLLLPLTLQAQPLVNLGLVGVGKLSGDSFDQLGTNVDTLGGVFSGMWLLPGSISKTGDTFYGTIIGLPDRGFGDGLRDYHPRIEELRFTLTPYYGPGPAPQNQITITNTGTLLLSQNGNLFTGALPDDTNEMNFPKSLAAGIGGGKWSLDPEGIVVAPDGSFYVSDEYGPFVYHFGITGQLVDVLVPPAAYIPRRGPAFPRAIDYNVTINPTNESGRYNNRGLEGLTLTPDGKKLVTVIQSPLAQDGESRNPSRNARILIYDIDPASPTARQAVAEYVVQLTLNAAEALNRHTPVSEILALSNTKFLILERDSRGRGGDAGPILYKKIVSVDVSQASNIIGTGYDLEKGAPGQLSLGRSTLPSNVVAAARSELVNLADTNQLARFGINVNTNWDQNTMTEKWEGMAVIPLNDPAATNDYLLLVGNDNDFKASLVYHNGEIVGTNAATVDSMLLAFRIGADAIPPIISCPAPLTLAANSNCVAALDIRSRVVVTENSAAPVTLTQTPAPGTLLPLGSHTVTIVATDAAGNQSAPCSTVVTVADQTAPVIHSVAASTTSIWPPNKKMVPVTVTVVATDNCDAGITSEVISITSDEAPGVGKHAPDWEITGPASIQLRAERSGSGNGRVYTITVRATDDAGNYSTSTTTVSVPKSQKP